MEQLKESILKKYQRATKKFIKNELKPKGFIINEQGIFKLNVFLNEFVLIDIEQILKIINENVFNWWEIPTETQKEIIYNNMVELIPNATINEINNYLYYNNTKNNIVGSSELKNDVKTLLNQNKANYKTVYQGGYNSPEYQSQALINNDVFYYNGVYYKFNNENKLFDKITNKDIYNILVKEFKDIKRDNEQLLLMDIRTYMRDYYKNYVKNSVIPSKYNRNKKAIAKLNEIKPDYEKVNKIISSFE